MLGVCFPRRDTVNEDNHRSQELLHFSSSTFGELVVHRGKSLGESCVETMQLFWFKSCLLHAHKPVCALVSSFVILTGASERLRRNVYYGFEANSGDFAVIYEWSLRWNKKMGKFFTTQEKGRIENCKKQASREGSRYYHYEFCGQMMFFTVSNSSKNTKLYPIYLFKTEFLCRSMEQKMSSTPSCGWITQTWCTTRH